MQKLASRRAQLIGSIVSMIIWIILILSLLYAFFTNQFTTTAGKVTVGILMICGVFLLISSVRFYLKNRNVDAM